MKLDDSCPSDRCRKQAIRCGRRPGKNSKRRRVRSTGRFEFRGALFSRSRSGKSIIMLVQSPTNQLVQSPTNQTVSLQFDQIGISRRYCSQVWLGTKTSASHPPLWSNVFNFARPSLPQRRLNTYETRCHPRYFC